jgi:hypothetical protein
MLSLSFELSLAAHDQALWLRMTGPDGVREFLRHAHVDVGLLNHVTRMLCPTREPTVEKAHRTVVSTVWAMEPRR